MNQYFRINLDDLNKSKQIILGKIPPDLYALILSSIFSQQEQGVIIVLVEDFNIAHCLEEQLLSFIPKDKILHFPDRETLPFDDLSPDPEIIATRLATLYQLLTIQQAILIVPIITLMHRICPLAYIKQRVLLIDLKSSIDLAKFTNHLIECGYIKVTQVCNHGEFAVRGSILDLFPVGSELPLRIDLLGDQVDSIRSFNIENQRTIKHLDQIRILPAQEYLLDPDSIERFIVNWQKYFANNYLNSIIYQNTIKSLKSPGSEYFLPLFFETTNSLFDYLPTNTLIIKTKECIAAATKFYEQVVERFNYIKDSRLAPILPVNSLFFNPSEIFAMVNQFKQIILQEPALLKNHRSAYNLQIAELPTSLEDLLYNSNKKIIFCVESKGRREVFKQLIVKKFTDLKLVDLHDFCMINSIGFDRQAIMIFPISRGFELLEHNIVFIAETDLFPNKLNVRSYKKNRSILEDHSIKSLEEINIGDPVVHVEYGIGKYLGLTNLNYGNVLGEFLTIEYAANHKLYVPITNLNIIHRYTGFGGAPTLHSLTNDKWKKEKVRVSQKIKDLAAELLEIYAKRSQIKRKPYLLDQNSYQKFIDSFPFVDTPDQAKASLDLVKDLTGDLPMDRVVCGDVGFGKTEIAMRAAFIVAENSRQVVVLAPTTLLAQQHYQTFMDRFADFPVRIILLSRFTEKSKQSIILDEIANAKYDIIIGTHRLLQNDLKFKKLGLLIIDEEHRFGVAHKEKLKKLRNNLDLLALTATPIPRTLNMAITGIRDLSIIATPPDHRLAIKTFVKEYDEHIIKEAIMRELQRGGQVYYLHNNVTTINKVAAKLKNLLPYITTRIAHGQMSKLELEHVMIDFYHRKFNVLVCTTIIESGIDVPNANTIIIERADCFGLSQLHQLRGRVGRSHHQAFAFCLIHDRKLLTTDAVKRLDALENLNTLGIGFTLATNDLEIRGAGELLGQEQSGNMQTIGFSLYMDLLETTVNYLKKHQQLGDLFTDLENLEIYDQVEIDLQIPALIPEDYIADVHTRLVLYQKIASIKLPEELLELMVEFIDRFGLLPNSVTNLFEVAKIKLIAINLGIKKIKKVPTGCHIEFKENNKINVNKLVSLLQNKPNQFKLIKHQLYFSDPFPATATISKISQLLQELT